MSYTDKGVLSLSAGIPVPTTKLLRGQRIVFRSPKEQQEIVCKDKPRILQKYNVHVESDTSIMIKAHQVLDDLKSSTSNDYEAGISERQAM